MCGAHARALLAERRQQVGGKLDLLRGGLAKLAEARAAVDGLATACAAQRAVVAACKAACEALLIRIVQHKRGADERERRVRATAECHWVPWVAMPCMCRHGCLFSLWVQAEGFTHMHLQVQGDTKRVAREAADAEAVAAECQASLDSALPAMAEAEQALQVLTDSDFAELKVQGLPQWMLTSNSTCDTPLKWSIAADTLIISPVIIAWRAHNQPAFNLPHLHSS